MHCPRQRIADTLEAVTARCSSLTSNAGTRPTACWEVGVGLLEGACRLRWALDTVKRYARADRPERMLRVPGCLAGPGAGL
jgi:hypothetical protein